MKLFNQLMTLALASSLVVACGDSKKKNDDNGEGEQKGLSRVDWKSIPQEYNPKKDVVQLTVQDIEKVNVNMFSFSDDVSVQYTDDLSEREALLEIYSISKDAPPMSSPSVSTDSESKTMSVTQNGSFSCSTQVTNRKITSLKGACYVKFVFVVPNTTQTEFYNAGLLVTKRLYAMKTKDLINRVKSSYDDEEDLIAIDQYLASYSEMIQKPSLNTTELGQILKAMSWTEFKIRALKKLHPYVFDRDNLGKMIDSCFTGFDREEARTAIGL